MIKKYRKKPVVIEAMKFDGTWEGCSEVEKFVGDSFYKKMQIGQKPEQPEDYEEVEYIFEVVISTLEGNHIARPGDMIIKVVHGEFYTCKPEFFAKTYEAVNGKK